MRLQRLAWLGSVTTLAGCSLIVDLSDLGGGADGASTFDVAEPDVAPPTTCKTSTTVCALAAPQGWSGPLAIYDGPANAAPATCPQPEVQLLSAFDGLVVPPWTCGACSCSVPNATCGNVAIHPFDSPSCTTNACSAVNIPSNSCQNVGALTTCGGGATATAPTVMGTCTVDAGASSIPKSSWTNVVLGCKQPASALVQVDCSSDQVCMPVAPAPFESHACIVHGGDVACPGAPYLNKRVAYGDVDDTRACSSCGCNTSNVACTGSVTYAGGNSGCGSTTNTAFGACVSFGNGPYWKVTATPPASPCAVDGGTKNGDAVGNGPTTICCTN